MRTVLASSSQRRLELLNMIGMKPEVVRPETEELLKDYEDVETFVRRVSLEKMDAIYKANYQDALVISSDTVVYANGKIIGKPKNRSDAVAILQGLSNNNHEVLTGIFLKQGDFEKFAIERTKVFFDPLTQKQIDYYLDKSDYQDKAGAYAIQGRASIFINRIEGCYFNVMGFPINLFYRMLPELNITLSDLICEN